jgi:hypothetical protein
MLRVTFQTGVEDLRPKAPSETLVDQAKRLLALREELAAEERRLASQRMTLAREALAKPAESERLPVPASEWRAWVAEDDRDR